MTIPVTLLAMVGIAVGVPSAGPPVPPGQQATPIRSADAAPVDPATQTDIVVTARAERRIGRDRAASAGAISGGGKAAQYYIRGFNLDHGTDFSIALDGVPMNLPMQAHAQGYLDLNGLIPETIDRIDYRKGSYDARDGDFSLVAAATMTTLEPGGPVDRTGGGQLWPKGLPADTRTPVIIDIHGGPEAQTRPIWNYGAQYFADVLQATVILPNVRGSDGYGKRYLNLDNGVKREDSVKDSAPCSTGSARSRASMQAASRSMVSPMAAI